MAPSNMWHFYVRKGTAYVPTVAQTDAGFFLDIEPIAVVLAADREALARAIGGVIAAGNPVVPAPARGAYPTPAVLQVAGVKTWSTFEKSARCYTVYRTETGYEIPTMERVAEGWVENPQRAQKLPLSSSHDDVARALVEQVVA